MRVLKLLLVLLATIFCGEFVIMIALDYWRVETKFVNNLLDATLLVIFAFPFLYLFAFRTIIAQNRELAAAREQLLISKCDLERRIEARTKEIAGANRQLEQTVARLDHRRAEMARLSDFVNFFQASRELDEAIGLAGSKWRAVFPGSSGSLFIQSASKNALERIASWGQGAEIDPVCAPEDCWALRRGKPHRSDGSAIATCTHLKLAVGFRHLCLPLTAHGEGIGILCLHYPVSTPSCLEVGGDHRNEDEEAFNALVAESLALALSNLRLHETLRSQASRDPLTGLFNRRYLRDSLERELHQGRSSGRPLALAVLDVDHFKRLNDGYGHGAGDAALRRLSSILQEWKGAEDVVARYGGEEFAILFPNTTVDVASLRLEVLRQAVEQAAIEYESELLPPMTISGGVAGCPDHACERDALIRIADANLYKAKRRGRNCLISSEAERFAAKAMAICA